MAQRNAMSPVVNTRGTKKRIRFINRKRSSCAEENRSLLHGSRWFPPGDSPDLENILQRMKRLAFVKPVSRQLTTGSNDYTNHNINPTRPSRYLTWPGRDHRGKISGWIVIIIKIITKYSPIYMNIIYKSRKAILPSPHAPMNLRTDLWQTFANCDNLFYCDRQIHLRLSLFYTNYAYHTSEFLFKGRYSVVEIVFAFTIIFQRCNSRGEIHSHLSDLFHHFCILSRQLLKSQSVLHVICYSQLSRFVW